MLSTLSLWYQTWLFLSFQLLLFASADTPSGQQQQQQRLNQEDHVHSGKLVELHRNLVKSESITGNENAVGRYLADYLSGHNFTVKKQSVSSSPTGQPAPPAHDVAKAERFNVLAYSGPSPKSRVLVSSHIDTVPPFWPYEVRNSTEIWGRGSVDAKGCVAAQITAVQELLRAGEIRPGDVAFLFVVGEETGGDGMRTANELDLSWEAAIFGEPTDLKLASGHKGNLGFRITAEGKAGHSGYPWLGESANSMLIPALAAIDKLELPSSEKYGNTTINIGRMEGGVAANVIAETASAQVAIRLAAGTADDAKQTVLDAIAQIDKRLQFDFSSGGYGPVYIDSDVEGFDTIVVNYGTDIPNLAGHHKRYLYGPGSILVAHSDHEHLTVDDLLAAVDGYKRLIRAALAR
ncbi:hypothetical protein MMC26_001381 [Xylographa opegraphella]|nr:hypothetical protein [Xylographa opegraphella]